MTARNFIKLLESADDAYMQAVERGDMETAQRMVDEAAKRAGYNTEAWHGTTRSKSITIFHTEPEEIVRSSGGDINALLGLHVSLGDSSVAMSFSRGLWQWQSSGSDYPEKHVYHLYASLDYAWKVSEQELNEYCEDVQYNLDADDDIEVATYVKEGIMEGGNDSVIYENAVEGGLSAIIFIPNQVKSADPVTLIDSSKPATPDNVIPLSQRFNRKSKDIRY